MLITKDKEDNPSIVIHYDIRHLSSEFAHIITQILTSKGIKVYLADVYKTTPQLSFAVRYLQTSAGIMITAAITLKIITASKFMVQMVRN